MNFDKFYKIEKDGTYKVHFLNSNGYTTERIKEIFSTYGDVLTVIARGDDFGFRIVKYGTLDETIQCVKSLQNSSLLRLLPEKSKNNDTNKRAEKNVSHQLQEAKKESSHSGMFNWDTLRKVNHTSETFDQDNRSDKTDVHLDLSSQSTMYSHKHKTNTFGSGKNSPDFTRHSGSSEQQNFNDKKSSSNFEKNPINFEKYYRPTKDSCYTIHFLNKKGLSVDEMKEMFSPYGNDVSIYDNGTFVFAKFKTVDDTMNCLKDLLNSTVINILPHKEKSNGTTKRTEQNATQDVFTSKARYNSNSTSHNTLSSEVGYTSPRETRSYNFDKGFDQSDAFSSNTFSNFKRESMDDIRDKESTSVLFSEKQVSMKQESFNDQAFSSNSVRRQLDTFYSRTHHDAGKYMNNIVYDDSKVPALISEKEVTQKDLDAELDSPLPEQLNDTPAKTLVPLEEVIVANIHSNYGTNYILHLFEKYTPIAITPMKTVSETNIRYCHVYFETVQDAAAVEKEFDKRALFGKRLMVLRKLQLIRESKKT